MRARERERMKSCKDSRKNKKREKVRQAKRRVWPILELIKREQNSTTDHIPK